MSKDVVPFIAPREGVHRYEYGTYQSGGEGSDDPFLPIRHLKCDPGALDDTRTDHSTGEMTGRKLEFTIGRLAVLEYDRDPVGVGVGDVGEKMSECKTFGATGEVEMSGCRHARGSVSRSLHWGAGRLARSASNEIVGEGLHRGQELLSRFERPTAWEGEGDAGVVHPKFRELFEFGLERISIEARHPVA